MKTFLEERYPDLSKSDPVEHAVRATGERIPNNPKERIEAYLDRIEEALSKDDEDKRSESGRITFFKFLRGKLIENYIIREEDIPGSYWTAQQRQAREEGHGDVEITDRARRDGTEMIRNDQIHSLDQWLAYLTSEENNYDNWFRYWSFRSVLNLSTFDKEKGEFSKRTKGTVAPFPEINREALAFVHQQVKSYYQRKGNIPQDGNNSQETQSNTRKEVWEENEQLRNLLENPNFGRLYAFALNYITPIEQMEKEITKGVWVTYPKGSDAQALYQRIEGKGTGWCISTGFTTLENYLKLGDFHIYYSYDSDGNPTNPRIAVRMDGNGQIAEIRGIGPHQELEPNLIAIADKKTSELPGGESYKKRYSDMKKLTAIDKKVQKGEELTLEELRFIYEIDSEIEGFGYEKDPRIREILFLRHKHVDIANIFGCSPDEVSLTKREALKEGIRFHFGDLYFSEKNMFNGLTLPYHISGNLNLGSLTTAEGLTLPNSIGGDLNLGSLTSAEGLTLPESIGRNLYLNSLTTAEGLTLPNSIGGDLHLGSLTSAGGLTLPESIGRNLYLNSLTTAEGLTLPNSIGGDLHLGSLTSAEGLTLPESIGRNLNLNSLTTAEGLTLPQSIHGNVVLKNLHQAELTLLQNQYPKLSFVVEELQF